VGFRDRLEREREGERGKERGAVKSNRYTEESRYRGKMREGKRGAERGTAGKMEREREGERERERERERWRARQRWRRERYRGKMREGERGIPKGGLRDQAGKMEGERESETEMEKKGESVLCYACPYVFDRCKIGGSASFCVTNLLRLLLTVEIHSKFPPSILIDTTSRACTIKSFTVVISSAT
jgi:hypothetical protein